MDFKIRKAKSSDAEDIAVLYLQFWETHKGCDPLLELRTTPTYKQEVESAKRDIRKRSLNIFVATMNNKVVGFIEIIIKRNDETYFRIKEYGYLNSVIVHEDYRRRGIAKALIETGLNFLKEKGIEYIKTCVYDFNEESERLMQESGFVRLSRTMIKRI
jgi:ribosomal protein S18 acetylase RimI-like enzyme